MQKHTKLMHFLKDKLIIELKEVLIIVVHVKCGFLCKYSNLQSKQINMQNMNVIGKSGVDFSIMLMERRGANGKAMGFLCVKININNTTSIIWNYSELQTLPIHVCCNTVLNDKVMKPMQPQQFT